MAEQKIKISGDLTSDEKFKTELTKICDNGYITSAPTK